MGVGISGVAGTLIIVVVAWQIIVFVEPEKTQSCPDSCR
jgi:hypothetical protein